MKKTFDKMVCEACHHNWPKMGPCMFFIVQFQDGFGQNRPSMIYFHQTLCQKGCVWLELLSVKNLKPAKKEC